jgi:hypothetical protein
MMPVSPNSLSEANALVPHIEAGIDGVRDAMARAYDARNRLSAKAIAGSDEAVAEAFDRWPELKDEIDAAENEARDELDLLLRLGVSLQSITPAVATVVARRGRELALLIWREGDDDFGHWRLLGEGRDSARPIIDRQAFGEDHLEH